MTNAQRIQSVIAEQRRTGHRARPSNPRGRRSAHVFSEAVVAGYIHDISQRHRHSAGAPVARERERAAVA